MNVSNLLQRMGTVLRPMAAPLRGEPTCERDGVVGADQARRERHLDVEIVERNLGAQHHATSAVVGVRFRGGAKKLGDARTLILEIGSLCTHQSRHRRRYRYRHREPLRTRP